MLLSTVLCLGGGIFALGSSIYASFSSNTSRPSKQYECVDDEEDHIKKGVGVRHRSESYTHAEIISALKGDGDHTFKSRCLGDLVKKPILDTSSRATTTATLTSSTAARNGLPKEGDDDPESLLEVDGLLRSHKPAIRAVNRWFGAISVKIDPDGNCYGTSWLIAVIVWAAQSPYRIQYLIETLEDAGRPGNAFSRLDEQCKEYVGCLLAYITALRVMWIGYASCDTARGACLAVNVIKTFMGDGCPEFAFTENKVGYPIWLKLKWGVAIASRALDVWTSCRNGFNGDLEKLRSLRESVELNFETLLERTEGCMPTVDVLRPGGSVGLLTGMVVDTYALEGGHGRRSSEDYTSFLADAIKASSRRTTTGLVIHQAGLPHFDVLVTPLVNALFFATLAANFGLNPDGGDAEALETLRRNAQSQQVTTGEEIERIVPDDELAEQLAAMAAFEGMHSP